MPQIHYKEEVFHYHKIGKGPAVVLLHGFAEDGTVWNSAAEALQEMATVLIPDLPGSGASGLAGDVSMEGLADAVYAMLQQESISRCVMIGHSMGGYVALAFAEQKAGMLSGLGLFHSTAYADTDAKKETRRKGINFIKEHGTGPFIKSSTADLFSPLTQQEQPGLIEEQIEAAHNFSPLSLVSYYTAMMERPDRTAVLKNSTMPALFVLGRWDKAVPLQDGLQQSHLPEMAYIHILESSAHMGMKEEQEKANAILLHYISAIEKTGLT